MEDMTLEQKIEVAAEQIENSLEIGAKDERKQIRLILTHFANELVNGDSTSQDQALHKHIVSNNEVAVCCATCNHAGNKNNPCNECFMHNKWKPQQTDC